MIERQHGEVGEFPDQDWSLRMHHHLVATARAGGWCTGTDPLAHQLEFAPVAAHARG